MNRINNIMMAAITSVIMLSAGPATASFLYSLEVTSRFTSIIGQGQIEFLTSSGTSTDDVEQFSLRVPVGMDPPTDPFSTTEVISFSIDDINTINWTISPITKQLTMQLNASTFTQGSSGRLDDFLSTKLDILSNGQYKAERLEKRPGSLERSKEASGPWQATAARPVPGPQNMGALAIGLVALVFSRRKRRKAQAVPA